MKLIKSLIEGRDTIVTHRTTTVLDASRLMSERNVGALPVLDGDRLVGIFSERDIMSRVVAAGRDPASTMVGDVMSTDLVVANADETTDVCLRRLQHARVRHLLVLESGRLAGIVSFRDLLALELDDREEAITLLNAYVHYIPADLTRKIES